ncbi:conserved hypothetical protein [Desulforapulum autotrophicum HRM2]|uniref:Uncharacterized protein n=1 Tax=Desulforapulum autotrophicum (strain ATCC 43914 / DSM 3382 / VKM B-1955 / HRM2) TaxID=177437 RepID=C0QH80_DESAH|nr:hypothetical protein [Desulforapulum autotrophicum]ACN17739.1 conserved hypothetical protein [Desulforapulum autotrophicum HRM2]
MKTILKQTIMIVAMTGMVVCGSVVAVSADDITDSITEGLESYKKGDASAAIQSLNYATQLMMQNKAQGLEAFLPAPLNGWRSETASSSASGAAIFGGGASAERAYSRGDKQINIQIITDSPMMQGVMMMFSNPMFATADGGKLEKIGKQKAIVTYDENAGEGDVKLVIAGRFFITIDGSGITRQDLTDYAKTIDYDKLAAMP